MTSIHQLEEKAIVLLRDLITCPSFSREEHGTADLIAQFLNTAGINTNRHRNNIWAANKHYNVHKPGILLNTHHDTVRPNASYTMDPFCPVIQEGKLFGLGSNDAGGCLVSMLMCFLYFYEQEDLGYNLIFAASAEEEISGKNGIESLIPLLGNIDFALVGEPTLLQAAVAEKGLLVLDCSTEGLAGHAAREEGINAIYTALDSIHWFRNFRFPAVSTLLGPVKMSVTQVNAGNQHNVVPDLCRFTVDIRTNECYSHEEILDTIRQHVSCTIVPRSMRLRSTTLAKDHVLMKAAMACGCIPFGSSTLSDKALMPFPALKIGPGDSARSHTANEFIYLTEIGKGIELYIKILHQLL